MSTISNTRPNMTLDLLAQKSTDARKPLPKDKGPLSIANRQGLSIAHNPNAPQGIQTREEKAQEAAEGLVSTTFIEPILKQMRESNNTPPPFGPSRAEKQFSALLDTKLSDEIVQAANFPLIERITAQLLRNMPVTQTPEPGIDTQG